jgi:hypothetical protein
VTHRPVTLAATVLALAGLAVVTRGGTSSAGRTPAVSQAGALLDAAPAVTYAPAKARAAAGVRGAEIPLPPGGSFAGIQWEAARDDISAATMDGVMSYNAACQWLRAWRDGRDAAAARQELARIPSWRVFRGTDSGAFLTKVATEVRAGGGADTTSMLEDCDTSHAREVAYARRLGLAPSS